MMTVAGNKPCPCGSGFKYKHCCSNRNLATPMSRLIFQLKKTNLLPESHQSIALVICPNGLETGICMVSRIQSASLIPIFGKRSSTVLMGNDEAWNIVRKYFEWKKPADLFQYSSSDGRLEFYDNSYVYLFSFDLAKRYFTETYPWYGYALNSEAEDEISRYEQHMFEDSKEAVEFRMQYVGHCRDLLDKFIFATYNGSLRSFDRQIKTMQSNLETQAKASADLSSALMHEKDRSNALIREQREQSYEFIYGSRFEDISCKYPNLLPSVRKSICRAEADWDIKRDDPHAANDIIFNYARAIEAQMCHIVADQMNGMIPSLKVIAKLCDEGKIKIKMSASHIGKLYEIAEARNDVDHGVERDWGTAQRLRSILFKEGLLQQLNVLMRLSDVQ